jgi:hypothetical protein
MLFFKHVVVSMCDVAEQMVASIQQPQLVVLVFTGIVIIVALHNIVALHATSYYYRL